MFCKNCGTELQPGTTVCSGCGNRSVEEINRTTEDLTAQDAPIDLRGQSEATAPLEKKYKPLFWAALISALLLLLIAPIGRVFFFVVMAGEATMMVPALFIVSLPFVVASVVFMLTIRKKARQEKRKTEKKAGALLYTMTFLLTAMAQVVGFAHGFTKADILPSASFTIYAAFAVLYLILCNAIAHQNGIEALYTLAKALFIGTLTSAITGYVLGTLLGFLEMFFIILVILLVAFFLFGGRFIYIHRD